MALYSSTNFCTASCVLSPGSSFSAFNFSITPRFFSRLACSSLRWPALAAFRASKNRLQAPRNSSQSWSPNFFGTIPMVFHSFCRAMSLSDVDFHSVLSCNAFAFSTSARFLSAFSLNVSLSVLKYSALRPKKSSHVARKRSKILTFIFCGAKPIVFHSACMAIISFVWRSQSPEPLFSSAAMALAFSHKAVLRARFSSSFERRFSKCCWWRLLITVDAALKRIHISSRSSLATGPISLYSACSFCNWWKALIRSSSSASFSAASQMRIFCSRFFLKSYSRASLLSLRRS